jgi:hypothetical protein
MQFEFEDVPINKTWNNRFGTLCRRAGPKLDMIADAEGGSSGVSTGDDANSPRRFSDHINVSLCRIK